jgi:hypothetical protein
VAKLVVGGDIVDTSTAVPIEWPSFHINFKKNFRCRLSTMPTSVCVQIFRRSWGGMVPDRLICSNFAPIPSSGGSLPLASLELLSPSAGWYQFSGTNVNNRIDGAALIAISWTKEFEAMNSNQVEEGVLTIKASPFRRRLVISEPKASTG